MDTNDVKMIADLAESIRSASPVQKDPESERLIAHLVASQPDAVYFLVQTVLLQRIALQNADSAPHDAPPAAAEEPARGFGGLFRGRRPAEATPAGGPGGGSFLKTAAAGAAGVAGGVLLAQGISGLFSGGQPQPEASGYDDDGFDDWSED